MAAKVVNETHILFDRALNYEWICLRYTERVEGVEIVELDTRSELAASRAGKWIPLAIFSLSAMFWLSGALQLQFELMAQRATKAPNALVFWSGSVEARMTELVLYVIYGSFKALKTSPLFDSFS